MTSPRKACPEHRRKAVALISGGLDSMLAARLMRDQGIHVEGINFFTGFCVEGHTHAIRSSKQSKPKRNNALWSAEQVGIKLHIVDVIDEYKDVVINPKHGYGAHLNPCLDCKGFMVRKAREWSRPRARPGRKQESWRERRKPGRLLREHAQLQPAGEGLRQP